MKNSNKFPKPGIQATTPRFCACCGMKFPKLEKAQLTQYKFCTGCGKPVLGGGELWTNIHVDDEGVLCADESFPEGDSVDRPMTKYVEFLAHTPGGLAISGIALASLGYGLVLVAAPLAAAGVAIAATGAVVIKTAVIGGTLMGILVANFGEEGEGKGKALKGILYVSAVVAAAGVSLAIAGGLFIVLAGIAGALGAVLITAGVITVGAVTCHQLYLQNRKHGWTRKAKEAIAGVPSEAKGISPSQHQENPESLWAGLNKITIEESLIQALRNGSKPGPSQEST